MIPSLSLFSILYIVFGVTRTASAQNGNRYCPGMKPVPIKGKDTFYVRQSMDTTIIKNVTARQQVHKQCVKYKFDRSFNGECTNPFRPYVGRALTPFFSYWKNYDASNMAGAGLLSAREISNIVFHQYSEDKLDYNYGLSEWTTFNGQFLDHNIVLSSVDKDESAKQDIAVPKNDVITIPYIKFSRNQRANRKGKTKPLGWSRAINVLPSAIDLFGVYGDEELALELRLRTGGLMRFGDGGKELLPLNYNITEFYSKMNAPKMSDPNLRKKFFIAGDSRSNENPQLTSLHTLWMRNHNLIAAKLAWDFREKLSDDDWLFRNARRINQAQYQHIIYEEYLPVMLGEKLKDCADSLDCFDPKENAGVSDIFANAAFRVGHTMVGNNVHRVGPRGGYMDPLKLKDAFFVTKELLEQDGIEPYIRGSIWKQAQNVDNELVEALRLKLFENVDEEDGVDLVSLNIQRGRDTNLPTFAKVKQKFLNVSVRDFSHITKDREVANKLRRAYGTVDRVELYPGLLCEDHKKNAPMGPTLVAIWKREFERLRAGDYHFYRNLDRYHPDIRNYKLVQDVAKGNGPTMREIITSNSKIDNNDLPGRSIWKCDYTCKN